MRRQFAATVVGISPAADSGFSGGAHTVTLALDGQGPCAPMPKNVEFPIFSAEEARALGSLYRAHHAVLVTFETSGALGVVQGQASDAEPREGDRREPTNPCPATGLIQVGVFNGSESDPPRLPWDIIGVDAMPAAPSPVAAQGQVDGVREAYCEGPICLCPATSEYDPPCPRHGVVGIGVTPRDALAPAPAPPMVGNRPSCCAAVRGADEVVWIRHGKWAAGDSMVHRGIFFCPFCGAKLPEIV